MGKFNFTDEFKREAVEQIDILRVTSLDVV